MPNAAESERAAEGDETRQHLQQSGAHDDDGDQGGGDRKEREASRPDRELGIRFVGKSAACHFTMPIGSHCQSAHA